MKKIIAISASALLAASLIAGTVCLVRSRKAGKAE